MCGADDRNTFISHYTYKQKDYKLSMAGNLPDYKYTKFIKMFNNFFQTGQMASTYKAVFLRALTDIGKYGRDDLVGKQWVDHHGDEIRMDLDFIAVRLAKYYWDMEIAFSLRHIPEKMANPKKPRDDNRMVELIRSETAKLVDEGVIEQGKPPTLALLASPSMKEIRKKVTKHVMVEVLQHLPKDMPDLYTRVRGRNQIVLDPDIICFMEDFSPIIKKALNYVLAKHLEKINPDARHIAIKIDEERELEKTLKLLKKLERQTE